MKLNEIFDAALAIAKADTQKALLPALATFFTSVAANPSAVNIAVQATKLNADLLAALPGIEQAVLAQIAASLNTAAQSLLTPSK